MRSFARAGRGGWAGRGIPTVAVRAAVLAAAASLGVLGAAPAALAVVAPEPPAPVNAGVQQIQVINGGKPLAAVSCAAVGWCAVGGNNGKVFIEAGGTWQAPVQVFPAADGLDGISCPTTSFCMAVSYLGGWAEWTGGKWSAAKTSMTTGGGWGVSCASAKFCMAEDGAFGDIDHWNGTSWSLSYDGSGDAHDGLGESADPISCELGDTSFCTYVDDSDYANHWNGTQWSAMAAISKAGAQGLVSCASEPHTTYFSGGHEYVSSSENVCDAVDSNGDTYWWNGSTWSADGHPDSGTTFDTFAGLSCVYYLCAAVDGNHNVLYEAVASGGAGGWSKPYPMYTAASSVGVSCAGYTFCMAITAGGEAVTLDPQLPSKGYWLASRDGTVTGFGGVRGLGAANGVSASDPVVGIAATPSGNGYFVVTRNGTVTGRGNAVQRGDLPGIHVTVSDIVGIAPTADGNGYWLVAADGGEFAFGDAHFHGSLPGIGVKVDDVVGMVASPDGSGYLMVGADGGVFAFGARYHGSLPGIGVKVDDIVGILPTGGEAGYVLVGKDGGAFVFGHGSGFYGSLPGEHVHVSDVVGIGLTPDQHGYWMCESDGTVHAFGDASVYASNAFVPTPVAAIAGT